MLFFHLTFRQDLVFACAFIIMLTAIAVFHSGKRRPALLLLFLGTLGLGYFIATLDPFLLLWDEQYHALVAKNMIGHPLKPTLYEHPLLPYDTNNWTFNHVWLHKQPLFLWQMALSICLFGVNELAVRIPDIIQHALTVLMLYRIGKITYNANAGFYGALFFAVASYPLELIAGRHATDHNDTAFIFYFTASFWAWFEYKNSGKAYWIAVIGLFGGGAVLVKWLTGLMVYAIWFITLGIGNKRKWIQAAAYTPMLISLAVACVIFIPWQWYILNTYPTEAAHEFKFNTRHFFSALEDHGGDIWFHFRAMQELYGVVLPLVLAGVFILIRKAVARTYSVAIGAVIFITYAFFTLAATKMASFCIIASPFMLLGLGALTDTVLNFSKERRAGYWFLQLLKIGLPFIIAILLVNIPLIDNFHTQPDPKDHCGRKEELDQMRIIQKIQAASNKDPLVVFNASARPNGYIEVMFYTDVVAYPFIPNKQQIEAVRARSYRTAIVVKDSLPEFLMKDPEIVKIYDALSK